MSGGSCARPIPWAHDRDPDGPLGDLPMNPATVMSNSEPSSEEESLALHARLAQIQVERAELLRADREHFLDDDDYPGELSDALHALAKEEQRIRKDLGLPPGEWDPGNWPEWGGWLILTLVAIGIPLLAWMTRPG